MNAMAAAVAPSRAGSVRTSLSVRRFTIATVPSARSLAIKSDCGLIAMQGV